MADFFAYSISEGERRLSPKAMEGRTNVTYLILMLTTRNLKSDIFKKPLEQISGLFILLVITPNSIIWSVLYSTIDFKQLSTGI